MGNKRNMKRPKHRNIPQEVHKIWLKSRKFGDVKSIQERLKDRGLANSQPVVTMALNHGFVFNPKVEQVITEYFNEELQKQLPEHQKQLLENYEKAKV